MCACAIIVSKRDQRAVFIADTENITSNERMAEWLISPYFSTLVQKPIECPWFIRVGMDKHELIAFPRYLNMVVRYDTSIPDDNIIAGIAPNGDDIFR